MNKGSLIPNLISVCGRNMNPTAAPEDEGQAREIEEKKDQARGLQSICKRKETYAAFLTDKQFNQDQNEEMMFHLIKSLRYRLCLPLDSKKNGMNISPEEDGFDIVSFLAETDDGSIFSEKEEVYRKGMYETLLQIIDEYDAAAVAEIFRLLLDRRIAIPLFQPNSKKHYLSLLRHITLPGVDGIRLGENKTLMRIAVISCRQQKQSQTTEIIKSLFHTESIYSYDISNGSVSSKFSIAEIGRGCVLMDIPGPDKVQQVLVIHVVGDFKPLWPFLHQFADFLLLEDSSLDEESLVPFIEEESSKMASVESTVKSDEPPLICVWKPSFGETRCEKKMIGGFQQFRINGHLTGKTVMILRKMVNITIEKVKVQSQSCKERLSLYQIPLMVDDGFSALECVTPTEIECSIFKAAENLVEVKKNDFLLQKNYRQQAKHEESKMEHRLNEEKLREEDAEIKKCRDLRRANTCDVQKHPLLLLFLYMLSNEDPSSRVLSVRVLEKVLAERSKLELEPQSQKVRELYSSYVEKQANNQSFSEDASEKGELELVKDQLRSAKTELIHNVLNIEHLWRELSHLYTAMEPESRSSTIKNIPRLAAQHLLDGFCLELLDGDSNMINLDWVKEVLRELVSLIGRLKRERIFVLSVMGVQSSGKSTMLNTMFGVQMRTSVGQCTRGVNMQLLAVEGRPEYDYILLLDTEGTRSPEHHGLPGSEKRDNQMATLSILLADATIVVTPGENDAAIKEILPIVLMAYQGSKLAEENGGRLSSRMFFVYNRIDTSQKDKLNSIIQTLGISLHEAFSQVQKLTGNLSHLKSESPFGNFKFDTPNSTSSDVCILGNVKKEFEPPGDVPNPAFGEALMEFREHIHRRVTSAEDGSVWRSRSIDEFSSYIEEVWKCICSADFTFNFASIVERITFDKLDFEYKTTERQLAEAYQESFESITKLMIEEKGESLRSSTSEENDISNQSRMLSFEAKLRDDISVAEQNFDIEMKKIVKGKGREKWSLQFQELWELSKKDQARNWAFSLRTSFITLFNYEHRVESYKKEMRQEINKLFKSATFNAQRWTEAQKNEKFEEMFYQILIKAKLEFPAKDVAAKIVKVYQNSNVIKTRQIEMYQNAELVYEIQQNKEFDSNPSILSNLKSKLTNFYPKMMGKKSRHNVVDQCLEKIPMIVDRISAGKLCYDDSVVSNVICDVDAAITEHNVTLNSDVQLVHIYGHGLIIDLMQQIEERWEAENSVFAKLQQRTNKDAMRHYFMMVSTGVEKTKLFAATLTSAMKTIVHSAFKKEMVKRTSNRIRNERWLQDARFLHKHMDLYLIDLLEKKHLKKPRKKQISAVLDCIKNPQKWYQNVLTQLIAEKVPNVDEEWIHFIDHLEQAIKNSALVTMNVDKDRAQTFVDQLRKEFLNGYLQSEHLASAFLIDFTGEYEDCDNESKTEFQEICVSSLIQMLEDQESPSKQNFAKELGSEVVQYMKLLNDPAILPRCDATCPMCKSLCIEAANHDTGLRPHNAIHQPGGIAGVNLKTSKELVSTTCSQEYELDATFCLHRSDDKIYNYREFATVFPGWNNPRINEELPLREYILATYNQDIAKMYHLKPCPNIPSKYFRDLVSIKEQLKREIEN